MAWSRRLGFACSRVPARAGTSRREKKTLKNYITDERKTTLAGNDVRASLRRIIPFLGRLRLGGPRH